MSPDGELVSAEALASLGMLLVHSGRLSQRTAVPCLHLCSNAGQLRRTNLARLRMLMCLQCSKESKLHGQARAQRQLPLMILPSLWCSSRGPESVHAEAGLETLGGMQ